MIVGKRVARAPGMSDLEGRLAKPRMDNVADQPRLAEFAAWAVVAAPSGREDTPVKDSATPIDHKPAPVNGSSAEAGHTPSCNCSSGTIVFLRMTVPLAEAVAFLMPPRSFVLTDLGYTTAPCPQRGASCVLEHVSRGRPLLG